MEEKVAIGNHIAEHGVASDVATWAVELKEARKTYRTGPIEIPALRSLAVETRKAQLEERDQAAGRRRESPR